MRNDPYPSEKLRKDLCVWGLGFLCIFAFIVFTLVFPLTILYSLAVKCIRVSREVLEEMLP